jgi:CspA family cold shock protein
LGSLYNAYYFKEINFMTTGNVKWFNPTKGYGFLTNDDSNSDVFIHISEVEKAGIGQLNEGQKVKFNIVENNGREAAADIELLDK